MGSSWLDPFGLFESEEIKPKSLESAWQTAFRKKISEMSEPGALERIQRAGEPYTGELVAPLSEYEQTGLGTLGKYLGTELPTESPLFKAATAEVEKTLGGEGYDPFKSEYYQAYRTNMMRELQQAKDRLGSATSARDAFFGGGRIAETGKLEETAMGGIAEKLGSMQEAERVRRLGAVPTALGLVQYGEQAPLGRVAAAEQYGALPRILEQMGLDAEQQEYLRQLTDLGIPLDIALQMMSYQPPTYTPTYQPSQLTQILGALGGGGGGGGGGAATSIASIMAMLSDIRCKENIMSIDDALAKVEQLDGKTYNYRNTKPEFREAGVIAQDLEQVLPEAVVEVAGFKYVKMPAVIALLVNAVKELNDKVNQIMPELN